jgi:carboxyl-terminal processing protease
MKNRRKETLQTVLLIFLELFVVCAAFAAGYLSQRVINFPGVEFPLVSQAYQYLTNYSYHPVPDLSVIEHGMIQGMLTVINDPYTVFLEPPQAELQADQLAGKFGGIGCRLQQDHEKNYFIYPNPDSPASRSGIQDGDQLLAVDDLVITTETTTDDIQAKIRGPVGSQVSLAISRSNNTKKIEIKITRAEVSLPSVTYNLLSEDPSIGLIQVNIIADTSPDEIVAAIQNLSKQGARSYILDLRNNGGGLVDAGVNVARLFLATGDVLQEQYRGKPVTTYSVKKTGKYADIPLVVLVNQNTASAAEIIAGALQGQKRAKLIGSQTYGKDSVQLVFDLSDKSSLHITAAHWWVPGLDYPRSGKGLQPDVLLSKDDSSSDKIFPFAIEALK